MDGEFENENGRNRVDLTLKLGSPYPLPNVLPTVQNSSSNGTVMNGGGPASVNYGLVNANINPVAWHPEHYNNYISEYNSMNNNGGSSMMGIPLVLPHHHTNFSFGDETSGSSRRRQRRGSNVDQNKRCTNSNCNTTDTPMWRKGPLGPKTLCNACGIKYRKEEERKRAKEAEPSPTNAQL